MTNRYDQLTDDIKSFHEQFEADPLLDRIKEKYYKGIQVLASPLVHRPAFMFIGINPGIGYSKQNNKNVKRFKALKHFEYLHYNYPLARETKSVFEKAELMDVFAHSVKTNCYFFATATADDLHSFLSHLKANYNVYYRSRLWIEELIDIVQPQIIICEGKGAFEKIAGKVVEKEQNIDGCYVGMYNGTPVVGYKRHLSYISKKDNLAALIKSTYCSINNKNN